MGLLGCRMCVAVVVGVGHELGGVGFGLIWFSIFLQPLLMMLASLSLLALYVLNYPASWRVFHALWIINVLAFTFITAFSLLPPH